MIMKINLKTFYLLINLIYHNKHVVYIHLSQNLKFQDQPGQKKLLDKNKINKNLNHLEISFKVVDHIISHNFDKSWIKNIKN